MNHFLSKMPVDVPNVDDHEPTLEELLAQITALDEERARRVRQWERLATQVTIANFQQFIQRTVSAEARDALCAQDIQGILDTPHRPHVSRALFTREEIMAAWIRSDHTYAGLAQALEIPQGSVRFYLQKVALSVAQLHAMELA